MDGETNTEINMHLGRAQRVLLETCTILYFIARNAAIPLMQQYVYYLVDKKYGLEDHEDTSRVNNGSGVPGRTDGPDVDSPYDSRVDQATDEASVMCLYLSMAELLPAAIAIVLLGFLSDITGKRKFLMWLPCLGNAVYALCFVLPLYINDADVDGSITMGRYGAVVSTQDL